MYFRSSCPWVFVSVLKTSCNATTGSIADLTYLLCRSTVHPASPPLLCTREDAEVAESPLRILAETPDSFEKHIKSILQRSAANPAFLKYGIWDIPVLRMGFFFKVGIEPRALCACYQVFILAFGLFLSLLWCSGRGHSHISSASQKWHLKSAKRG